MYNTFIMDHVEGKANLYEELPGSELSQLNQTIVVGEILVEALGWATSASGLGWSRRCHRLDSLQILFEVAFVSILHDQI